VRESAFVWSAGMFMFAAVTDGPVLPTGAKELEEDPILAGAKDTEPEFDELLPIVQEAVAELDDPTGAGVLLFDDEEDDDIYLIMARIPCTQHTRQQMATGV
jgi:hypothetical protein